MTKTFADRVEERLKALDMSPSEASVKAGRSRDFLRKTLKTGSVPRGSNLADLATALETSEAYLLHGVAVLSRRTDGASASGNNQPPVEETRAQPLAALSLELLRAQMPQDVPVYGTAAGSFAMRHEGAFEMESRVIEHVRRPPSLMTVVDAYAIYITGSSMWPEHKEGDICYVHPYMPPRPGDSVVLQAQYSETNGVEAFVGKYVRRNAEYVILSKHNPQSEVSYAVASVKGVHRIVPWNELFGL